MTKAFERVTMVSQEIEKGEDWSRLESGEEIEEIFLREAFPKKMVRIGRELLEGLREEIISVLREYANIFAWSVADMPGIDRSVICHRLAVMEAGPSHTVKPWWDMAVDGASGPKGCGAGIVFTTLEGFKIYRAFVFNFKLTSSEAEYEALASRLSDLIRALLREMEEFRLTRIPQSENIDADMLSKLMQSCPEHVSKLAKIEILDQPSVDRLAIAEVQEGQNSPDRVIEANKCWRTHLMEYMMTGQNSYDEERARKVVLRAPQFQALDGHLYKRAFGGPLMRCLTNPEVERVIAEVHEGGKKFVMIAIDYFTKWVEAEAMATITDQQCEKCVLKNIITRFGAPKMIVTDNGQQFRNPRFTAYLGSFGIKHNKALVAYPQEKGQVANRTIVNGMKKRLGEEGRKWLEALPHTIWAH
ncbi:unnamed protein product [Cuscuta campestris]|uniref:Integrase catalytic domain-containing protein n=1 Tax=Cuscuta campestris TaxID=132261 RepID=A0A484MA41_9ASTE|nr:unnamed protein product [Cuscuta campestris]